ncbi:hypothetical protein G7Z17_g13100 [Cylindrodendrum hubeiense]|uniref:Alpha/beta hydrolase fold-3 domain-containing protein n=1 Tax=Cylindrodendrum hubeiense TaxID=595255 RepID=A0A9P5GU94_9HYPO|nr:hypothetical protein G7Z17_g13100 [Cylindrodendrum hubeiense]
MSQNQPPTHFQNEILRPPYDPLLIPAVEASKNTMPGIQDLENLRLFAGNFSAAKILEDYPSLDHVEYSVPGLNDGDAEIKISVFKPKSPTSAMLPALYNIHGGGQVAGNRFSALGVLIEYFNDIETVFISVEYRLAPEHPAPAALHDAYAGLLWATKHSVELGIDCTKIIVGGASGGGPIAVGATMLCRDNQRPFPGALMLLTPIEDTSGHW